MLPSGYAAQSPCSGKRPHRAAGQCPEFFCTDVAPYCDYGERTPPRGPNSPPGCSCALLAPPQIKRVPGPSKVVSGQLCLQPSSNAPIDTKI
ncbi:hypothetical protein NDU88_006868 [Pleurodeles waltl]|uniref:Uncharacterized protein n=1 Tax=Pleurodeles waltl TaxID=8319 RepID=A0AAV7VN46_PLEWA|nr:hypothetical protein NDU88_006868 [Pleurodeles waltl]